MKKITKTKEQYINELNELHKRVSELEVSLLESNKVKEEFEESISLLHATLNSTADGILIVGNDGNIKRINKKFIEMWNIPDDVSNSRDDNQLLAVVLNQLKDPDSFLKKITKLYSNPGEESFDTLEFKDGRVFERYSQPQIMNDNIVGRVWSFRNVTGRYRKEEALQESEQRYQNVIKTAPLALVVWDIDCKVVDWNRQAENMFGWLREEIIGGNFFEFLIPESERPAVEVIKDALLKGELINHGINENLTKSGNKILCEWNNSIFHNSKDQVVGVISLGLDITERVRQEKKLEGYTVALERSNKELEQFAYVASHDLQEPLRMVASYTQLLAKRYEGKLDSDADEFIAYAVDGATRMQVLINDLLAYSRVGTRSKGFKTVSCNDILKNTLTDMQNIIEENDAKVTNDPLPSVVADDTQISQLFLNLIGNAIKFKNNHQPRVHISAEKNEKEWIFSFQDNGIGIEKEYADRIFIIFQRLQSKSEYPGTGIGLAICKKIVECHGGRIWMDSVPGKGSTFHFTIPMKGNISHEP